MTLTLEFHERRVLEDTISRRLRELSTEIRRTDGRHFRHLLRQEADSLESLLAKLTARTAAAG